MNLKIIRIKPIGAGFSVLIETPDGLQRGFSFPAGDGWEDEIKGEPKFIGEIKRQLEEQKVKQAILDSKLNDLQKNVGKVFKDKKPKI